VRQQLLSQNQAYYFLFVAYDINIIMLLTVTLLKLLSMMPTSVKWKMRKMKALATEPLDLQALCKDLHETEVEEGMLYYYSFVALCSNLCNIKV